MPVPVCNECRKQHALRPSSHTEETVCAVCYGVHKDETIKLCTWTADLVDAENIPQQLSQLHEKPQQVGIGVIGTLYTKTKRVIYPEPEHARLESPEEAKDRVLIEANRALQEQIPDAYLWPAELDQAAPKATKDLAELLPFMEELIEASEMGTSLDLEIAATNVANEWQQRFPRIVTVSEIEQPQTTEREKDAV
jgi:fructosamine-3-kinase